jgi:glycosyltransferase involved in cell wall biosynthesis
LHTVADWGIPSERFVVDLVRGVTTTRPVVVCGRRHPVADPPAARVHAVLRLLPRRPEDSLRRQIRMVMAAYAVLNRARLLHAHFGYYAAHTAAVARRIRRPWLVSLHGYDVLVMAPHDPELDRVTAADAVVVPSTFLAGVAVDRGFAADRIHVIPSGIRVADYPFRERRGAGANGVVTATFAGRFVAKKGVLDAARAMAAATQRQPALRCRFVGYGPLESELRSELDRLRLDATVVDGRSPGAVVNALTTTDIVVTPSRTASDGDAESLGLVNVEAQACGVPVLSTRHGGIPEAVAAEAGVLVDEGDVAALTASLIDLVQHPERWPAMGRAGRAHVEQHFELTDRVRQVEELYATLLSR